MMCARLLRHTPPERSRAGSTGRPSASFDRIIAAYGRTLRWVLGHQPATLLVAVATLGLTVVLYVVVPKGFFPVQDTGVILGISEAPQTISFPAMAERQQALAARDPRRIRRSRACRRSSASTAPTPRSTAAASSST